MPNKTEVSGAERVVYHVVPNAAGGWDVKREGGERASAHFELKDEAIERARELAKGNTLGQVKVHDQKGVIQTEWTYGEDPPRYPG